MESINKLLDKAKELSSSATDMALAEKLGIERTTLSSYRNDRSKPNVVVCAKLAAITNEPLAKIIGIVEEARAISEAEKRVWRRLANAAVLIMCTLPIALFFAGSSVWTSGNLYIMSGYMLSLWLLSIVFINVGNVPYPHEKQGC